MSETFTPPVSAADDPEYAANLRRATLASTAGSALEYFDFALYGLASALIFSELFFSNLAPSVGLIASFATFGVGFSPDHSAGSSSAPTVTSWAANGCWSPQSC
jgi:hypothetical protein